MDYMKCSFMYATIVCVCVCVCVCVRACVCVCVDIKKGESVCSLYKISASGSYKYTFDHIFTFRVILMKIESDDRC